VRARAVRCAEPTLGSDARAIIMGGQNAFVRLASSAVSYDSATGVFSADVAIENLLGQALGTPDGVSADPEGIRVFFFIAPVVTAGSGQATVANPDGTGTFTAAGQPFFRYPGMLAPRAVTAAKSWRFQLDRGVITFAVHVLLDVRVEPKLVITEIMAHPATAHETAGEWFEVYNAGRVMVDLNGYTIASGGDAGYTITGPMVLLAGQYAVLGGSADTVANGGLTVGQAYTGITLGNDDADWLALRAPTGLTLDSVSWGAAPGDVPAAPGLGVARALVYLDSATLELSGAHSGWKNAVGVYGPSVQRGTPGKANPRGVYGGISIGAGYAHTCMADRDGIAWCWGLGPTQLGTGLPVSSRYSTPTRQRVAAPAGVRFDKLALSGYESCALSFPGELYCWGLAPGLTTSTPTGMPNPAAPVIESLVAGMSSVLGNENGVCEIDSAGAAYCLGSVAREYFSDWVALSTRSPVPLQATQVALGYNFACALASGRVYCYGVNGSGQLGDSTTTRRSELVEARLPPGVTFQSVVAAGLNACALSDAGQAYCWGDNGAGQLGIGFDGPRAFAYPLPLAVRQPAGVTFTSLTIGAQLDAATACGLTAAGQAYCWGWNGYGRVGNGTNELRVVVPTAVVQRGVVFSAIASGERHTCALEAGTGQPFCWGDNEWGQLGEGIYSGRRLLPVPVVQ
jgi:alpha-tubulin suppressor-like RCC1 family protein